MNDIIRATRSGWPVHCYNMYDRETALRRIFRLLDDFEAAPPIPPAPDGLACASGRERKRISRLSWICASRNHNALSRSREAAVKMSAVSASPASSASSIALRTALATVA